MKKGTVALNADGTYTYTLDNTNPTVNQLSPGETLAETYTYVLTANPGVVGSEQIAARGRWFVGAREPE